MSGFKRATISISQDEYDRLRDAEGKLKSLPSPSVQVIQIVSDQSLDLLRSNLAEMENRQARYQEFMNGLNESVQDIERSANDRMVEIESQAANRLEEHIGSLRTDFEILLKEQEEKYEEFVLDINRQQQAQMANIAGEMDQLFQDQYQKECIAQGWLNSYANLFDFIQENYATGFFSPHIFLGFEQQLVQAETNFQNGFIDAVLLESQQGFRELSQYRLDLEQKHNEWNFLYQAAWEAANQELILIESSKYVPALDLDGNELPYLVDVRFWNPGDLDELSTYASEIANKLLDHENLPDIATLKQWLNEYFPSAHRKLEQIIFDARIKTINSQLRVNVADLVVQALQEQGFSLASSAYNDYDLRLGYGARLTNIEGNEVVVQVSPTGSGIGENELQIRSLDSEVKTEHELQRRWQEVSQSLAGYGMEVGRFERLNVPQQSPRSGRLIRERGEKLQISKKNSITNGN
jgi:hypothetical protein